MNHSRTPGSFSLRAAWGTPAFFYLTAMLLCGAAAGSLTGLRSARVEGVMVAQMAQRVLDSTSETLPLRELALISFVPAVGWPLLLLLCSFLRPRSLFTAAGVAARGFLFSFAVGALLGLQGTDGVLLSLASCASGGIFTLPAMLLIGTASLQAGMQQPQGRRGGYLYALSRYRSVLLCGFAATLFGGAVRMGAMLLLAYYR